MSTSHRLIILVILGSVAVTCGLKTFRAQDTLYRLKRAEDDDHGHEEEDDHGHEEEDGHGHEGEGESSCRVTDHALEEMFSALSAKMGLTGPNEGCHIEDDHHDDNETEHGHDDEDEDEHMSPLNLTCESTFEFVRQLLINLDVTSECCLGNETACEEEPTGSSRARTGESQAYGYGFLMVIVVSACSLLGLLLVPFLGNSKFKQFYKYFYALMIALGASALFCDAILHLIPEAFGLHDHGLAEEGDVHGHSEEEEDQSFIWKGVVVIVGTYFFFLFETILHTWTPHDHHHYHGLEALHKSNNREKELTEISSANGKGKSANEVTKETEEPANQNNADGEVTNAAVSLQSAKNTDESTRRIRNPLYCIFHYFKSIKPLAWLIIFGDAIHNFADGLALGAAIAQSLSLGLSTMIALIFHEIPHELGDFVILISTGMKWYIALVFNFVSALTAVLGFFIGVAISTHNSEANSWILAIAAGVFLYIALVDLLPELIHSKEKGCNRWLIFLMANIGLGISFVALLVLAVYEEKINTLISL